MAEWCTDEEPCRFGKPEIGFRGSDQDAPYAANLKAFLLALMASTGRIPVFS